MIIITFLSGILAGISVHAYNRKNIQLDEKNFLIIRQNYDSKITNIVKIIKNNLTVNIILLSGAFLFGSTTLIQLFRIGFMMGSYVHSFPPHILLVGTLPHGIFEFASYVYTSYYAIRIQPDVYEVYTNGDEDKLINVISFLLTRFTFVTILVVIAAFIEVTLTPKLLILILKR